MDDSVILLGTEGVFWLFREFGKYGKRKYNQHKMQTRRQVFDI